MREAPRLLSIDETYVQRVLLDLLHIPSPTGRTDRLMQFVGDELKGCGLRTNLTRRGALIADLPGRQKSPDRAVMVHADTLGAMVRDLKENGRLAIVPIGTWSARFAEGARVFVFADGRECTYTGTILPLKASGHAFDDEIDRQPVSWSNLEVRVDERSKTRAELEELGIQVGDHVAILPQPLLTDSGYVNARHLDDKAGIAAALGAVRAICSADVELPVSAHLLVTISEEVGQGASHGLHADVAEIVSLDNGVVAPGHHSDEHEVTIAMSDSTGPFDYHLIRKLEGLAREFGIPTRRDVFLHYRSDVAAAIEAGVETRAALLGFGLDASHGYERTHLDSILHLSRLVTLYLQSDLAQGSWDVHPSGPLEDFPSSDQPEGTPLESGTQRFHGGREGRDSEEGGDGAT